MTARSELTSGAALIASATTPLTTPRPCIVSREFRLPAVIGAHAATTRIPHRAQVQVDPKHGTVRVL
jgi:phosphohistidine swiveling domain-containing protein